MTHNDTQTVLAKVAEEAAALAVQAQMLATTARVLVVTGGGEIPPAGEASEAGKGVAAPPSTPSPTVPPSAPAPTPAPVVSQSPQPDVTLEEIRSALSWLSTNGKREEAIQILRKTGYNTLPEVPAELYPAMLAEAQNLADSSEAA